MKKVSTVAAMQSRNFFSTDAALHPLKPAAEPIIAPHGWLSLPGQNSGLTKSNRLWERGANAGMDCG
jgi:hypothetical protein